MLSSVCILGCSLTPLAQSNCSTSLQVTHWHSPYFFAYFPTASSYPAMLADMLCGAIGCIGFSWVSISKILWRGLCLHGAVIPLYMGQKQVALSVTCRQQGHVAESRVWAFGREFLREEKF